MTRPPARCTGPLLDLRTFVIVASAVLVGVLAASDGIGAALASALGAAATLHALVDRGRRDR